MADSEGAKERVLRKLETDITSADVRWSLFISALESYRHDSILRPFPSAYIEDDGNKNFQALVSENKKCKLAKGHSILCPYPSPPSPPLYMRFSEGVPCEIFQRGEC